MSPERMPGNARATRVVVALAAFWLVAIALAIVRMEFHQDDFHFLVEHSPLGPQRPHPELSYLSSDLPFQLALALGGVIWPFALINTSVYLLTLLAFAQLISRLGLQRLEVLLATLLFAFAPGYLGLVMWASGLEQLGAYLLLVTILLLVDRYERRERGALLALAAALLLTGVGVFVKFSVTALAVPLAFLFGRVVVPASVRRARGGPVYVLFAAAYAIPLLAMQHTGWFDSARSIAGLNRFPENMLQAALYLLDPLLLLFFALLLLGGPPGTSPRKAFVHLSRDFSEVAASPFGGLAAGRFALLLGGVCLLPFLTNTRNFAPYYVVLSFAWLAPLLGRLVILRLKRTRRSAVVVALAVALLLPVHTLLRCFGPEANWRVRPWLDEVATLLREEPRPCRIRLDVLCPKGEDVDAARRTLHRRYRQSEFGYGIVWRTGWRNVPIILGGYGESDSDSPTAADEICDELVLFSCGDIVTGKKAVTPRLE